MTRKQRIATRIAFILITISGGLLAMALTHTTTTEASYSSFAGTYYGVNETLMNKAIGGTIWPQATSNACAISDIIGLVNYDYLKAGKPLIFQIALTRRPSRVSISHREQASGDTPPQSTRGRHHEYRS